MSTPLLETVSPAIVAVASAAPVAVMAAVRFSERATGPFDSLLPFDGRARRRARAP